MKMKTRLALAFLAVAGTASTAAFAADNNQRHGGGHGGMRFERADTDNSGDVTFEEFSAAMSTHVGNADADKDGKMTVAEIAAEIERMRSERMARRIVERFDANGDGVLTQAEIEGRQKKLFALMDRNDDGKIAKDEMPKRKHRQ